MSNWIEKQKQAKTLVEQVKNLNHEGIDSGEKAAEAHAKMADVQRLMGEVKAEKLAEEKAALVDLLSAYEAQEPTEERPPAPIATGIVTAKNSGPEPTDPRLAASGRLALSRKAMDRLQLQGKALNEGSGGVGGFLVPPAYMQNMFAETRRQGNALRRYGWLATHPVDSNQILLPRGAGNASVGIVAENATKPNADQTYTQVTVNTYTWAGISKISNQLLQDSSPTATDLVTRELGSLLGNLEEQKIISGTGTGEPRGILNTTGINTAATVATTGQGQVDAILDLCVLIQTTYFSSPNGILMHPRRLAFLQKSKDTANNYIFNDAGTFRAPGGLFGDGVTSQTQGTTFSMPTLLGLPVGVSTNIPSNLGAGTNEDRIIVADWNEAHWFQRQDITLDVSDTAGTAFETNQTWFRLEERAGFSAERYPTAFGVLTGTGLV